MILAVLNQKGGVLFRLILSNLVAAALVVPLKLLSRHDDCSEKEEHYPSLFTM